MVSQKHRLLGAEREQSILNLLHENEVLTVSDLCKSLNVSEATMRRSLQSMHERGLLQRIHGGATLKPNLRAELMFTDKDEQLSIEKSGIAEAALKLVHDNDILYLDGGSTVLRLARLLDHRQNLTIVTNSLMAASLLMESGHRLILTGGEFRAISRTLVGPLTSPVIQNITVDKAFMGTIGLTLTDGMSTTDPAEAFTKSQVLSRARQVILLADHTKFGLSSFVNSGSLRDIDVLVTDFMGDSFRERLEQEGITIVTTKSNLYLNP